MMDSRQLLDGQAWSLKKYLRSKSSMDTTLIKNSMISMCLETDFKSIWQVKKSQFLVWNHPNLKLNSDKIRKNAIIQSGLKHSKWSNFWPSSQKLPQKHGNLLFKKLTFSPFLMKNWLISQKYDFQGTKVCLKTYSIPLKHKHEPLWLAWVRFYSNKREKWFFLRIS